MTTPGPGWHPDPEGNQQLRYWDGQQWTSATQPPPQPTLPPAPPEPIDPEKLAKDRKGALIGAGVVAVLIAAYFGVNALANRKDDAETVAAETTTSEAAATTTTTVRPTVAAAPPATTSSRVPATSNYNPADDPEFLFLGALTLIGFPDTSDSTALEAGRTACASFRKGEEFMDISLMTYFNGPDSWTPENAGQLVGAAVSAFCPQYKSELPR
ncbi:DUF732 domain-containing protein [Rhodococcus erythropolis]|uniref:DUF732 domain-containing protein n=1 Tax=Rhodococcus erythropolis TaxID=1833 RepID=UPI001C9AA930|nr:DUF732 domain-containing protein [Rhodococcus erythropolis]MBY6385507.1 DUF732 domain-containing protein [Rhodococcus erythropolis]